MLVNGMKKSLIGARFASISSASIKPSSITLTIFETAWARHFVFDRLF